MSRYLRHSRALKVCRNREQGQRPRLGLLCSTVGRVSLRALERRQVWLVPVPPPRQPSPTHLSLTPPPEKSLLCSTAESLNVHPRRKGSGNNYHVVTDECTRYKAPGKAQLRSSDRSIACAQMCWIPSVLNSLSSPGEMPVIHLVTDVSNWHLLLCWACDGHRRYEGKHNTGGPYPSTLI